MPISAEAVILTTPGVMAVIGKDIYQRIVILISLPKQKGSGILGYSHLLTKLKKHITATISAEADDSTRCNRRLSKIHIYNYWNFFINYVFCDASKIGFPTHNVTRKNDSYQFQPRLVIVTVPGVMSGYRKNIYKINEISVTVFSEFHQRYDRLYTRPQGNITFANSSKGCHCDSPRCICSLPTWYTQKYTHTFHCSTTPSNSNGNTHYQNTLF